MQKITNNTMRLMALIGGVSLLALGSSAAFTATTAQPNNKIDSGTVAVGSDVSGAIYSATDQKPGDVVERCVRVTFTGSLASTVKAYISAGTITNGTLYNLKIDRGTQTTGVRPSCGDFVATGVVKADGPLGSTATTYAGGYDIKGSAFALNDNVVLRFTLTHNDDTVANAHTSVTSSGLHEWTFEARNN